MILKLSSVVASLSFMALIGSALADESPPVASEQSLPQATIHFADHGGIQDWRADGESAIFIMDQNRHWFHAQLMFPCRRLPFEDRNVGFESEPNGDFDNLSFIKVGHERCQVVSLIKSEKPAGAMK
jgi:hypothetical protein